MPAKFASKSLVSCGIIACSLSSVLAHASTQKSYSDRDHLSKSIEIVDSEYLDQHNGACGNSGGTSNGACGNNGSC
ncbi:MAG: hypothetical protein AB8G05_23815 [Oligoflexales bacterium]